MFNSQHAMLCCRKEKWWKYKNEGKVWWILSVVRVPPITFTRMSKPRHNILSNVRADIRKYVVAWLKHSRECNRPVAGPICDRAIFDREQNENVSETLHTKVSDATIKQVSLIRESQASFNWTWKRITVDSRAEILTDTSQQNRFPSD